MIHAQKKAVSEIPKPLQHTHTHTHTHNYKHQISKTDKADESKHTPGKRNQDTYINQSDKTRVIYSRNKSDFKSHWVPHVKGVVPHMLSDESNELETHTLTHTHTYIYIYIYIYISRM